LSIRHGGRIGMDGRHVQAIGLYVTARTRRVLTGEVSGREYIRVGLSAPELGARPLYANLGRAAGQDDEDAYALIWNPND
jgi:uncharacterized protein (DUF736 family)